MRQERMIKPQLENTKRSFVKHLAKHLAGYAVIIRSHVRGTTKTEFLLSREQISFLIVVPHLWDWRQPSHNPRSVETTCKEFLQRAHVGVALAFLDSLWEGAL